MPVSFRLNGSPVTVDVPTDMPLLWVIRDVLELKGTKFGCGIAQCGACTVHVDGEATRSCRVPVEAVEGLDITTIEGLSPTATHPLQEAWLELDVPQCGYCQAGQLMAAAGLLASNPNPSDADIDAAMERNLCRCGTYLRIREGIHRASQAMTDGANRNGRNGAGRARPDAGLDGGPGPNGNGARRPAGDGASEREGA